MCGPFARWGARALRARLGLVVVGGSLLRCSSPSEAALSERRSWAASAVQVTAACDNPALTSALDCALWMVDTPWRNAFDGASPGLPDAAGNSTGFPALLASATGEGYAPERVELRPEQGELVLSTAPRAASAAGAGGTELDNALAVALALPDGIFRVTATLRSPPAGSGAGEAAGIWFGLASDQRVQLGLRSSPAGLALEASLEDRSTARAPLAVALATPPERVRVSLEIDPLRREIRAFAALDAEPERSLGSFFDVPAAWLRLPPAQAAPAAGIFATQGQREAALGGLRYRFAELEVQRRLALPRDPAAVGHAWSVVPALPDVTFSNATQLLEAPGTGQLMVSEREGHIFAVPRAGGKKTLVLDLSAVTQGHQDCGLLGMALHPRFGAASDPSGNYLYVHYAFSAGPMPPPVALTTPTESRLSRFSLDPETLRADPDSEFVLIAQRDENVWHQGGGMFFHPDDGYLYLSVGDEGGSLCAYDNCQRIDRDLFGGVLRIDVDMRGGNFSHPIPRQPESGATAGYFIPNDNPFVGSGGLEEFYALGLRSPHRMTLDPGDGSVWIGDVGQNHEEELDVLAPGANYQWPYREGRLERAVPSGTLLGTWTDPVLALPRDEAMAVIGGHVYRGSRFPELSGKYVFGDFVYGNVWAVDYRREAGATRVLSREKLVSGLLGRSGSITSFGVDADGELYILTLGSGPLLRLERSAPAETLPPRLSAVGAFDDLDSLEPSQGLVAYAVQVPLYSDGAHKRRWLLAPEGTKIQFAEAGPYRFASGTTFVKHFELALDERQPERRRRLETRFLVNTEQGYYGISYRWNADGSDATPVLESELETLRVTGPDGSVREQPYLYPAPSDCLVCHNAGAGHVLGVRTAQLNGPLDASLDPRSQLLDWSERGLLDTELDPAALAALPRLAALEDESRSLEDRVRSYLDANCSNCHGSQSELRAKWDGRYQTPLAAQGLVGGALWGEATLPAGSVVVAPGEPGLSALYLRDGSNDPALRMPPLGRQTLDAAWLDVLTRWIQTLPPP